MAKPEKTVSFRASSDKIDQLDALAAAQDRPRSYLINEAIANYLEIHSYQDELVRAGLEQLREGKLVSHEQVLNRLKKRNQSSR